MIRCLQCDEYELCQKITNHKNDTSETIMRYYHSHFNEKKAQLHVSHNLAPRFTKNNFFFKLMFGASIITCIIVFKVAFK